MEPNTSLWNQLLLYGNHYVFLEPNTSFWNPILLYGTQYFFLEPNTSLWNPILLYGTNYVFIDPSTFLKQILGLSVTYRNLAMFFFGVSGFCSSVSFMLLYVNILFLFCLFMFFVVCLYSCSFVSVSLC